MILFSFLSDFDCEVYGPVVRKYNGKQLSELYNDFEMREEDFYRMQDNEKIGIRIRVFNG